MYPIGPLRTVVASERVPEPIFATTSVNADILECRKEVKFPPFQMKGRFHYRAFLFISS